MQSRILFSKGMFQRSRRIYAYEKKSLDSSAVVKGMESNGEIECFLNVSYVLILPMLVASGSNCDVTHTWRHGTN